MCVILGFNTFHTLIKPVVFKDYNVISVPCYDEPRYTGSAILCEKGALWILTYSQVNFVVVFWQLGTDRWLYGRVAVGASGDHEFITHCSTWIFDVSIFKQVYRKM
jgi:hypothetical protein